jgi:DNA-directed RNA polymerase subunit RPC12/RpoP
MRTSTLEASCARCGSQLELGDLRCPICALAVPREREPRAEALTVRVVRCGTCGASLEYSAEARAPLCAYCASVMHVEMQADPVEQAGAHLPFTVAPEAARAALQAFLARKGFFRPADLSAKAALQSLQPLWWPGWAFTAEAQVAWTADSDAGAHRSAWAPHSGSSRLVFRNVVVPASRGLKPAECQRLLPHYDFTRALPEPQGPEGTLVERFDATRSGARKQILAAVEAEALAHVQRSEVPGSRSRNVHVAVVLSGLHTARYSLPAYVLAYRYREKSYRVVVHGQDAACVLGESPVSVWKVLLTALGVLLLVALVLALVLR